MLNNFFKNKYIKNLMVMFSYFLAMLFLIFFLSQNVHFLISDTDSLPQHYFLHFPRLKPKLKNYTVVWSDWQQNKIIKQIIGLPGDRLWFNGSQELFINDFKVGALKTVSQSGKELHPIKAQIIPEDSVFLYSPHGLSFDSRYQELGLVKVTDLQGLVVPLI